jgi:hypothetical protein
VILATGSAPAAPATGRVTLYAGTDNKLYMKDAAGTAEQVGTGGASAPYLWRNALLNGGFALWQRQNLAAATEYADDAYCADRWYVLTQNGPIDAQRIDGSVQRYAARLTQKQTTAQQFGLAQIVEGANCRHLRGQSVTFSARVRCSAACTARIAVLEWTGGEDSVTSDVVADWANWTLAANVSAPGAIVSTSLSAATWAELEQTVTLGSTFTNLIVFVWTSALDASTTLDVEAAQLERGSAATPFEVRPVGAELALCQRYCYVLAPEIDGTVIGTATRKSTLFVVCAVALPSMRVVPTFSHNVSGWDNTSAAASGTNIGGSSWVDADRWEIQTSGTIEDITGLSAGLFAQVQVRATTSFDGNPGDAGDLRVGSGVRLIWDAEL